jgi:hypothetical protein
MALSSMMAAAVVYAGNVSALGSNVLCGEVEVVAIVMVRPLPKIWAVLQLAEALRAYVYALHSMLPNVTNGKLVYAT